MLQKGSIRCCPVKPRVAAGKQMSYKITVLEWVSVVDFLWSELEAEPTERHKLQIHVFGFHDKPADAHLWVSCLDSSLVQVLPGYRMVTDLMIW